MTKKEFSDALQLSMLAPELEEENSVFCDVQNLCGYLNILDDISVSDFSDTAVLPRYRCDVVREFSGNTLPSHKLTEDGSLFIESQGDSNENT